MTNRPVHGGERLTAGRGGCLRALIAAPALAVLAPIAALCRSWARWRRGSAVKVEVQVDVFERSDAAWSCVSASVDIPFSVDAGNLITETVVRVAESLSGKGEVFHLVHREAGRHETIAVPLGTAVNDLAERMILSCRRSILDGTTLVWPAVGRGRHLGEVIDPVSYDPEAEGEPDRLLESLPMTWALVLRRRRGAAATLFQMKFVVPEANANTVVAVVNHLRR